MTDTPSVGESILTQPGAEVPGDAAVEYATGPQSGSSETRLPDGSTATVSVGASEGSGATIETVDPLNAAMSAMAGEPLKVHAMTTVPSQAEVDAAVERYIAVGVEKVCGPNAGPEFRAAIERLLRHLHLDHPENYLGR